MGNGDCNSKFGFYHQWDRVGSDKTTVGRQCNLVERISH